MRVVINCGLSAKLDIADLRHFNSVWRRELALQLQINESVSDMIWFEVASAADQCAIVFNMKLMEVSQI